jgi:hypothetical protein
VLGVSYDGVYDSFAVLVLVNELRLRRRSVRKNVEEYEFACELETLWYKLSESEQAEVEVLTDSLKT